MPRYKLSPEERAAEKERKAQPLKLAQGYEILRSFYRCSDLNGLKVPLSPKIRANLAQDFDTMGICNLQIEEVWVHNDLLETAALAQHYGMPTRLLDWTYDIYVALYFAFFGALEKGNNLAIWALNKEYLSFLKPTVETINVHFITPHYADNPNINAQKGLFTHWPVILPSPMTEMDDLFRKNRVNTCRQKTVRWAN